MIDVDLRHLTATTSSATLQSLAFSAEALPTLLYVRTLRYFALSVVCAPTYCFDDGPVTLQLCMVISNDPLRTYWLGKIDTAQWTMLSTSPYIFAVNYIAEIG